MKTYYCIVFLWCIAYLHVKADDSGFIFRRISPLGGLSTESVNVIFQDDHNFIWLGTNYGLIKYSINSEERFINISKRDSCLMNASIHSIALDNEGALWTCTGANVCVQGIQTNRFENFVYSDNDGPVKSLRIYQIINDHNGQIWLADSKGFGYINKETGYLHRIPLSQTEVVCTLFCDQSNQLWAGTQSGTVYQVNKETDSVKLMVVGDGKEVSAIYTRGEEIWVGSMKSGLKRYSPHGELQEHYDLNKISGAEQACWEIRKILIDKKGVLWVSTYHGLFVQEPGGTMHCINSKNNEGLPHSSIFDIYEDRQNGIWVGTWAGGVSYYHETNNLFVNYAHSKNPQSISNSVVSCFAQDENGTIYVGTERGGMNLYDKKNGVFSPWPIDKDGTDFNIKHQCFDINGGHWVATKDHGVWYKAAGQLRYQNFVMGPEDGQSISHNDVYALCAVDTGVWIGTHGSGINFYDFRTQTIKFQNSLFSNELDDVDPYVKSLSVDSKSNLWIGTVKHLKCISLDGAKRQKHSDKTNRGIVYAIKELSTGEIWFGTKTGLGVYDPDKDTFSDFGDDKLQNLSVYGIQEDHNQHIWLTTNEGLFLYKPELQSLRRFDVSDGIQGLWFNPQSAFSDKDGMLYFGGTNGFTTVLPDNLKLNTRPPQVTVHQIVINNKREIYPYFTNHSKNELRLQPDETTLRFRFASDNYVLPEKNNYQYRLLNFYDEWIDAGADAEAVFVDLSWGNYIFEVKSSNNDGIMGLEPTRVAITIEKPFYATTLAFSLYLLVIISLSAFLIYIFSMRTRLKNEFVLQTMRHQQEDELKELKLTFFTNVSHEFKTPLSLISGPVSTLMKADNLTDDQRSMLDIIQRNSRRLLILINQIIDFRRMEEGKEKVNFASGNILDFIKERCQHFSYDAQARSIEFEKSFQDETLIMDFDPEKLDYIIFNLLSNSFKYSTNGTRIQLSVAKGSQQIDELNYQHHVSFGELTEEQFISVVVKDEGAGIEAENLEKVFNRFYGQAPLKNSSGIGLSLCLEFTLLLGGKLEAYSTPGQGSCFVVSLPLTYSGEHRILESYSTAPIDLNKDESVKQTKESNSLVLVVEDNPDLRAYIYSVLKPYYHVRTAENGKMALDILEDTVVDIIVSDVMMPEMDGFEFCAKIKSDMATSHLPIILLTALSSTDNRVNGMKLGADAYISKPFSDELLLVQIENLLTQRHNLRKHFDNHISVGETVEMNGVDSYFLKNLNAIIARNLNNEAFDIEMLTKEIGISRSQLHRKLNALTNYSTSEYIRVYRLGEAVKLLKTGQYNIDEVGHMVGFNTHSYFSRCFKQHFNQSPKQYLAQLKECTNAE